jgi:hypothetical protein
MDSIEMNKKLLTRFAIVLAGLALIGYLTYLLFALTNPDRLRTIIHESVRREVAAINIPAPKDGKDANLEQIRTAISEYMASNQPKDGRDGVDGRNGQSGQNATYEQVKQAVDEYFQANPLKNGIDGADGNDGKTPQLRCNVEKNRWEVRFNLLDTWQLLNGEKVECTTGGA